MQEGTIGWGRRARQTLAARWVMAVALAVLLPALAVDGALDGILAASHLAGQPAYGGQQLVDVALPPNGDQAATVVATWCDQYRATAGGTATGLPACATSTAAGTASPVTIARWYLWIDLLAVIPGYVVLLGSFLLRVRRRLDEAEGWIDASDDEQGAATWGRRVVLVGLGALAVAAAGDVVETALSLFVLGDPGNDVVVTAASIGSMVKTLALPVAVLALLVGLLVLGSVYQTTRSEALRAIGILRAQVAVVAAVVVLLLVVANSREQVLDVMRAWPELMDWQPVLAWVGVAVLGVTLLVTTRRVLDRAPEVPTWDAARVFAALAAACLLLLGGIALATHQVAWGLVVAPLVLGALALLSRASGTPGPQLPVTQVGAGERLIPRLLAVLPLAAFALTAVHAAVTEAYAAGLPFEPVSLSGPGSLTVAAIVLHAVGWGLYWYFGTRAQWDRPVGNWIVAGVCGALAGLAAVWVWSDTVEAAERLGTMAVIFAFFVLAALVMTLATYASERTCPPSFLGFLLLRRVPFLGLAVVWLLAASLLDTTGYHHVRVEARAGGDAGGETTLRQWFDTWLGEQRDRDAAWGTPRTGGRRALPLVLVASEGGGIRAAYWTALALECTVDHEAAGDNPDAPDACGDLVPEADGPARRAALFATSGASGGSVGFASWAAHMLEADRGGDWVEERLGADFAASALAALLFNDVPNAFLRRREWADRAELLERAFERPWLDRAVAQPEWQPARGDEEGLLATGLFELWRLGGDGGSRPPVPLPLLNSTSVRDGCRINVSPVRGGVRAASAEALRLEALGCLSMADLEDPASADATRTTTEDGLRERAAWVFPSTMDLSTLLCRDRPEVAEHVDVRLSTAALLSARFPFVSPTGRLDRTCDPERNAYAVDGGYLENSGAGTALEVYRALQPWIADQNARREAAEPCVVPLLVQLDNHYSAARPSGRGARPLELGAPVTALLQTREGHTSSARQGAAAAFGFPQGFQALDADGAARPAERYAYIHPNAHPGLQAPLGWALSEASKADLNRALRDRANREAIRRVQSWLSGDSLVCPAVPAGAAGAAGG